MCFVQLRARNLKQNFGQRCPLSAFSKHNPRGGAFSKAMTNGSSFKCCSNLFYAILLFKTCVVITAVYLLLNVHFNRGVVDFSAQPVARSITNWTRDYIKRHFEGFTSMNSTTKRMAADHKKELSLNVTKNERVQRKKKRRYKGKSKVIIFVGIISAPQLIFRRNALRRSWLKQCKKKGIPCLFFTDGQDMHGNKLPPHIQIPLHQEQLLHGDMILAESPGGVNFARRYLWMLNWANARYKFDYFLRIDDDYFVCMDRLLLELPHRPRNKLYWGHVHCSPPGKVPGGKG